MSMLLHFHEIAAGRGDGLRSELIDLLRRADATGEVLISVVFDRAACVAVADADDTRRALRPETRYSDLGE